MRHVHAAISVLAIQSLALFAASPGAAEEPRGGHDVRQKLKPGTGYLGLGVKTNAWSSGEGTRPGVGIGILDEWTFPGNFAGRADLSYLYTAEQPGDGTGEGFHSAALYLGPRYYFGESVYYAAVDGGAIFNHVNPAGESSAVAFTALGGLGARWAALDVALLGGVAGSYGMVSLRISSLFLKVR